MEKTMKKNGNATTGRGMIMGECTRSPAETKRVWRARQLAEGLCSDCVMPAKYPFSKCEKHLKLQRIAVKKYIAPKRIAWKITGRCVCCGRKLDRKEHGSDVGHASCYSCRFMERPKKEYAGYKL